VPENKLEDTIYFSTRKGPSIAVLVLALLLCIPTILGSMSEFQQGYFNSGAVILFAGISMLVLFASFIHFERKKSECYIDIFSAYADIPIIKFFKPNELVRLYYNNIIDVDCKQTTTRGAKGAKATTNTIHIIDKNNKTYRLSETLFKSMYDFQHCYKTLVHKTTGEKYDDIEAPNSSHFVFSSTKQKLGQHSGEEPTQSDDSVIKRKKY
jgi:hypothetical protein